MYHFNAPSSRISVICHLQAIRCRVKYHETSVYRRKVGHVNRRQAFIYVTTIKKAE